MKPWLFDILACPIDKKFPLELYIFSFENKETEFKEILEFYKKRDIQKIKNSSIINIEENEGQLSLKDDIVIEKTPVREYLDLILLSIREFNHIHNKTSLATSNECFNTASSILVEKITNLQNQSDFSDIENILPELYFLNKLKIEIEIETGLLFCPECCRWFPIIETIPQMLPDEFRNADEEIKFLNTNKHLLDDTFLKQDLKPFKI